MAETLHPFTTSDGYIVHYRHDAPVGPAKARMVLLHGIQSHGGWYRRSCQRIASAGIDVYFMDRRGCGQHEQNRGDAIRFRRLLDDIAEFIKTLPTDVPIVLAGISWGGKLATAFNYRHPGLVQKIALLCPGLFPKVTPSFWSRFWIGRCAFRNPTKMFPIPLNDPELFTASVSAQEMIRNDKLALREATARMMFQSFCLDIYIKRAWKRINVPTLLMLAEHDRIINNDKTRRFVNKFRTPKNTIIEYKNAHHTLEFEPEDHPFVNDLVKWTLVPNNGD